MAYNAFISYSHNEHGAEARKFHQELTRFATPWYRRRRLRLFLDDANLPASPSLWNSIEKALDESEYMIFLASPAAASSHWCEKEIRYWLEHKSAERILLVLLSGNIAWDDRTDDFDRSATTSLPKALYGVFPDEPRHIEIKDGKRGNRDGTARTRLADVASVLLDTPKDDLIGEDLRQNRQALRLAWGAAGVLLTVSLLAVWQWYQASVQRDLAQDRLTQAVEISERMLFDIDEKLSGVAGTGELRRSLTYDALSLLIKLRQQAAGHLGVEWGQMSAYYQKGNLALRYDDLEVAEAAFTESRKIAEQIVEREPGYIEPYHSLALTYHGVGKVKAAQNRFVEAYDAFDRAKQLTDFILEDQADDEDTLLLLLNLYRDWGDAAYENRDIARAHKRYQAGIRLIERLTADNPDDAEYWFLYSVMLDRKARYFPIHEDPQSLLDTREEAAAILKRLVDEFPDTAIYKLNLGVAYEKLGDIAFKSGNLEGARNYFSAAMAAMQALYAAEPINNLYKEMLAVEYGKLGETHFQLGNKREALDLFEQEHNWMQTLAMLDPKNHDYALGYTLAKHHLGDYYAREQDLKRAEAYYLSAIDLNRSTLEQHTHSNQAWLLLANLRTELAELLIDSDPHRATVLIEETCTDLERWLDTHKNVGEGWLYLAQARTNQYLSEIRSGKAVLAERSKSAAYTAIARINQDERKRFAFEIKELLGRLENIPD